MSKQKVRMLDSDTQWIEQMLKAQEELERKRKEAQNKEKAKSKKQTKKSGK